MTILKDCRHCGLTEFRRQISKGKESYYCVSCHIGRQRKRRAEKKAKAVAYKGGKCMLCGYSKSLAALDFHHTDPAQKDADFTQMKNWLWDRIVVEIDKCILVCANCHREIHDEQRPLSI